jgi:hypothetical protein
MSSIAESQRGLRLATRDMRFATFRMSLERVQLIPKGPRVAGRANVKRITRDCWSGEYLVFKVVFGENLEGFDIAQDNDYSEVGGDENSVADLDGRGVVFAFNSSAFAFEIRSSCG